MAAWEVSLFGHVQFPFCDIWFLDFGSMLWKVPVTIATKNNPEAMRFVLEKACDTVTVEGVGPDDWVLVSMCVCACLHAVVVTTLIFSPFPPLPSFHPLLRPFRPSCFLSLLSPSPLLSSTPLPPPDEPGQTGILPRVLLLGDVLSPPPCPTGRLALCSGQTGHAK